MISTEIFSCGTYTKQLVIAINLVNQLKVILTIDDIDIQSKTLLHTF